MPKEKSNWQKIEGQQPSDSVKYRDVYDDQQLDRSKIGKKKSAFSRVLFTVIVGIFVFAFVWLLVSFVYFGVNKAAGLSNGSNSLFATTSSSQSVSDVDGNNSSSKSSNSNVQSYYYMEEIEGETPDVDSVMDGWKDTGNVRYYAVDENGNVDKSKSYSSPDEIKEPKWHKDAVKEQKAKDKAAGKVDSKDYTFRHALFPNSTWNFWSYFFHFFLSFAFALLAFGVLYQVMMRNLEAQNAMNDTADINQYPNDQHIALPEEIQRKFDWFPDVGAHSSVLVSSMISHMALTNKGLKNVTVGKRAKKDILDEDGEIEYYKGELLFNDDGTIQTETKPIIDTKFMDDLFEASGAPNDKSIRKYYDATKIPYNPGNKNREKLKDYDTVADLINGDWELPIYEPQRPAGAYIVDTDPVNTMV